MIDVSENRRLSIEADLTLSVDGVEARLVGDGSDLTLRTDEPAKLAAALRRCGALPQLRRAAAAAPSAQLGRPSVTMEGPRGAVVTIAATDAGRRRVVPPAGTTVRVHRPMDLVSPSVRRAAAVIAATALLVLVWRRSVRVPRARQ